MLYGVEGIQTSVSDCRDEIIDGHYDEFICCLGNRDDYIIARALVKEHDTVFYSRCDEYKPVPSRHNNKILNACDYPNDGIVARGKYELSDARSNPHREISRGDQNTVSNAASARAVCVSDRL